MQLTSITLRFTTLCISFSDFIKCPSGQFRCDDGKCIPESFVCNVWDNCGDRSYEPDTSSEFILALPCMHGLIDFLST